MPSAAKTHIHIQEVCNVKSCRLQRCWGLKVVVVGITCAQRGLLFSVQSMSIIAHCPPLALGHQVEWELHQLTWFITWGLRCSLLFSPPPLRLYTARGWKDEKQEWAWGEICPHLHKACHLNRYTESGREKESQTEEREKEKGAGNVAEWLSGDVFLVTCLGGASASRAGSGPAVVVHSLCALVWMVCALVCVCFHFFFFFTCYESTHHSWQWSRAEPVPGRTWGPRRRRRGRPVSDR